MKTLLFQSLIITISFISVFLWEQSKLATYTVPVLGILTSFYLVTTMKRSRPSEASQTKTGHLLIVFLLNTSSLLLIQATGGLQSTLFFLIYFLSFYISFTLEAEIVFLFTLAVFFFFLPEVIQGDILGNSTKIISFLLLSPLAYFFGKEIVLREKKAKELKDLKEEATDAAERIIKDVSDIVKSEGKSLKEEDLAKLHDIVEESKHLEKEARE